MTYYGEVTIGHDEHGCPIEMTVDSVETFTDIYAGLPTSVTIHGHIRGN